MRDWPDYTKGGSEHYWNQCSATFLGQLAVQRILIVNLQKYDRQLLVLLSRLRKRSKETLVLPTH